jgi:hypothetical protein
MSWRMTVHTVVICIPFVHVVLRKQTQRRIGLCSCIVAFGLEAIWGEAGINPVFIGCGRRSGEAPGARSQPSHHLVPFGLQTA